MNGTIYKVVRTALLSSILILLDLSASFDTANHQVILSILLTVAIMGTALAG